MALVELLVDDVDLMQEIINSSPVSGRKAYDASYAQLGRGRFGGHYLGTRPSDDPLLSGITELKGTGIGLGAHHPLVVASRQHYGAHLRICGASPSDRTAYYFVAPSTQLLRARGVLLQPGDLIEVPPASEMDFVTDRVTIFTLSFENSVLDSICRATGHRPAARSLSLSPRLSSALSASVLEYLHAYRTGVPAPEFAQRIAERFTAALASAVTTRPRRASSAACARAIRTVEDWLHAHLHAALPSHVLANIAGVPLRTLQHAFAQELGVPPHVYHARLRMRAARAFLARHTRESASVTVAARAHGFAHLGRFSTQYRGLFGESPSATLAREHWTGTGRHDRN